MAIKIEGLVVLCDGQPGYQPGYCNHICSTKARGDLDGHGRISAEMPEGWTQIEGKIYGKACAERMAVMKVLQANVPDPKNDPPIIQESHEVRKEIMREVIKEDLSGSSKLTEKVSALRERAEKGSAPDFSGTFDSHKVEVRVCAGHVEIEWRLTPTLSNPTAAGMTSITLRHENLELIDPPPFLSGKLVDWIQNCLRTMKGEPLQGTVQVVN